MTSIFAAGRSSASQIRARSACLTNFDPRSLELLLEFVYLFKIGSYFFLINFVSGILLQSTNPKSILWPAAVFQAKQTLQEDMRRLGNMVLELQRFCRALFELKFVSREVRV